LAIIRWTSTNPGGDDEHLAVIHYGTDPKDLGQTAKSPIRLNRGHAETIFRVRVDGVTPQTIPGDLDGGRWHERRRAETPSASSPHPPPVSRLWLTLNQNKQARPTQNPKLWRKNSQIEAKIPAKFNRHYNVVAPQ
jgi:hypothetical protein